MSLAYNHDADYDDFHDKYEREDYMTPEQAMRDLNDEMERPYGSVRFSPRVPRAPRRTPAEWHAIYPYICPRCKHENKDDTCFMCGAECFKRTGL